MVDIGINIDVVNKQVTDEIGDAIDEGIRKGAVAVADEAGDVARNRIRSVGAIFTGDLVSSFEIEVEKRRNRLRVKLKNTSDHAAPIEYGAEYTDEGPPVAALIPWVELKMRGFSVPDDEITNLPEPDEVDEDTTIPEPDGPDVDLLDVADEDTIQKAFWLQQHIKETGIDAVRYMKAAEEYVERRGSDSLAGYIERELRA